MHDMYIYIYNIIYIYVFIQVYICLHKEHLKNMDGNGPSWRYCNFQPRHWKGTRVKCHTSAFQPEKYPVPAPAAPKKTQKTVKLP